jgi:hypothetical protein
LQCLSGFGFQALYAYFVIVHFIGCRPEYVFKIVHPPVKACFHGVQFFVSFSVTLFKTLGHGIQNFGSNFADNLGNYAADNAFYIFFGGRIFFAHGWEYSIS